MINQLKVYNVGEKIRVGNTYDGGYVLPKQMLEDSECLFSYGIYNDITFDEHYIQLTNKKAYGYDHTIEEINTQYPELFTWYKKGLSGTTQEQTGNFVEHYNELQLSTRTLLKVDVESSEYEWLENTDIQKLADITTGIVIEFHCLSDEDIRNRFIAIINNLNKYFYLCHIHGNNWGTTFQYDGYVIPDVIEMTFISKALVKDVELDLTSYPTELDTPNNVHLKDYPLPFTK
jgi:hypothetical protein